MKKMTFLLGLAALTATAFAQDVPALKFSGYLDSGIVVQSNGKDAAPFGLWGNDAGKNGGRFNLDGVYGTSDAGLKFEFRSEVWNASTAPVLKYGFVYANLASNLVTVNAGIVKDGTWNTTGDAAYKPVDSEPGLQVIVKPVAGLTLGTFVNVPYLGGAAAAGTVGSNYLQDASLDFAASYGDKTFTAVAGLRANPTTAEKYANADANSKAGITEYYASAGLLAVPNLNAVVELKGTTVNDYALQGKTEVVETLKYNLKDAGLEALTAGLIAYQWVYGADQKDTDGEDLAASFRLTPWVSYKVDAATYKLGASYVAGAEVAQTDVSKAKFTVAGFAANGFEAGYAKNKLALFQVKPEASFVLSPNLTVTAFYAFTTSVGADKAYFINAAAETTSLQTVAVDFLYKF